MDAAGTARGSPSFARARDVDVWCDRYEADWKAGRRPQIEGLLADAPEPLRADLVPELVALDVALRQEAGERPTPDEYRSRFPGLPRWLDAVFGVPHPSSPPHDAAATEVRTGADLETLVDLLATRMGLLAREPGAGADDRATTTGLGDDPGPGRRAELGRLVAGLLEAKQGDPDATTSMGISVSSAIPRAASGRGLDRFQVVRLHAQGGLGVVFLARDEQLHREVALKEIRQQHAHRAESRARFLREAEITGALEHPGIVPIYALGEHDDGRPYYAMRFIRGESLKEALERFHRPDAPSVRREGMLEFRGLLRRFVDVCDAMAFAHSRGVVHRDLKPANIMLGTFGETLVVDWGLAKPGGRPEDGPADDPGMAPWQDSGSGVDTMSGSAIGTPAYMSPEQADGELARIGPASDVYSLGATLYCLLTGRAPFEDPYMGLLLARVRRGDFPPPRRVNREVPAPLESICLKAMALRPEGRYDSARALAEDVERWLADERVSAHRDGPLARLARWGRHHRTAVVGATALLTAALVALAIGTVLIGRESARREEQRRLAASNFALARDAVDRMLSRVGEVELADVPQMESARRELLTDALQFYKEFVRRGNDPSLRLELGRALIRLARVQELLGDPFGAEASYRRAIETLGDMAAASASARADLGRARDGLGMLLKKSNRFRESEAELRSALRLREGLAREASGDAGDPQAVAESRYHLGALLARLRDRGPEDERSYRAALDIQRKIVGGARGRAELRGNLARYLNNFGLLLADDGRDAEAEAAFREAAGISEELSKADPGVAGHRWQWARALNNLGARLPLVARADEAEAALARARGLLEALRADFPAVLDYRRDLASVHSNLGRLWAAGGRRDDAAEAYRAALKLQEAIISASPSLPDDRRRLATTQLNLGLLRSEDDPPAAEVACRAAVDALARLLAPYPDVPEYRATHGTALGVLARVKLRRGDLPGARRSLERAIDDHKAALASPRDRDGLERLRTDHGTLAVVLVALGDHAGAAVVAERLPDLLPDARDGYIDAAAFLARCSGMAASDATLPQERRAELETAYAGRAVEWLRRAAARDLLTDPAELDRDDYEPLRGRDDFERLRSVLQSRGARPFG